MTGNPEELGGSSISFGTGAGSGTFSAVADNNDGTYTAKFTGTAVGPVAITATLNGQNITSALPTINV
jgi:adhesin/invasin